MRIMKSNNNHQPIVLMKTNLLGISESFNRPTVIALSIGLSVVQNSIGQINFDLPRNLSDQNGIIRNYALADFDRDGWVDIAGETASGMTVFRNNGDDSFTFDNVVDQGFFNIAGDTKARDISGDGIPDLVWLAGQSRGPYFIEVAVNAGDGSSWQLSRFSTTDDLKQLEIGDIDEDGDNDIVAVTFNRDTLVLENTGNGFLPPRVLFDRLPEGFSVRELLVGDFDGDGDLDIAFLLVSGRSYDTRYYSYYKVYESQIKIFTNDGSGNYPTDMITDLPYFGDVRMTPRGMRAGDFDGDGDLDFALVVGNTDYGQPEIPAEYRMAVNEGIDQPLIITDAVPFGQGDARSIEAVDLDSDGRIDLIMTASGNNGIFVFANQDGRGFKAPRTFPTGNGSPGELMARDMNNDGKLDVISRGTSFSNVDLTLLQNITLLDNPILEISPLIRGERAQITITGLKPLEQVWVGMTDHGWANTVGIRQFGGITFDLADIAVGSTNLQADADGTAVLRWTVPANIATGPVLAQAAVRRGSRGRQSVKSPFVKAVIHD